MQLKLLGITYNDDEIPRVVQLRTLEWDAFPVFATRSFAPIALFWMPWWLLILVLAGFSIIWCPIRNHIPSARFSALAALCNMAPVAIPVNIIIAIIFFSLGRVLDGCIALVWNLVATIVSFAYPPSREPALQYRILSKVAGVNEA
jgi:hypothetical protein